MNFRLLPYTLPGNRHSHRTSFWNQTISPASTTVGGTCENCTARQVLCGELRRSVGGQRKRHKDILQRMNAEDFYRRTDWRGTWEFTNKYGRLTVRELSEKRMSSKSVKIHKQVSTIKILMKYKPVALCVVGVVKKLVVSWCSIVWDDGVHGKRRTSFGNHLNQGCGGQRIWCVDCS